MSKLNNILEKCFGDDDSDTKYYVADNIAKAEKSIKILMLDVLSDCYGCGGKGKVDCDNPTKSAEENHQADDCEVCGWIRSEIEAL